MWVNWNAPQAYTFYKEDINGKMLKYSIKCVRHALSILIPTQCELGFSKQFGQLGPGLDSGASLTMQRRRRRSLMRKSVAAVGNVLLKNWQRLRLKLKPIQDLTKELE